MLPRTATLLLLIFGVTITGSAASAAQSFIVSGNPYAPPVVWEEHKQLTGAGPDLVKAIFDELGLPYSTRVVGDWAAVQEAARNGDIDLIVSAYKNEERSGYLNFSVPYLNQPTVIVVEKGKEFPFTSWKALQGKKGVTGLGESYGQEFDTFLADHLDVTYLHFERALQELNLGKADYLIIDLYTALIYTRHLQGEDSITILDPPVTTQSFHLAVAKDSPLNDHLEAINARLEARIADGTVTNLLLTHFDNWRERIARRSEYLSRFNQERSADQEAYLKLQDEMARERLVKLMSQREGPPVAAQ